MKWHCVHDSMTWVDFQFQDAAPGRILEALNPWPVKKIQSKSSRRAEIATATTTGIGTRWTRIEEKQSQTKGHKQQTQTTRTMFPWSMTSAITKNIEKLTRVTRCENPPQFASWLVRALPAPKTWYMSMTSLDWDSPSQHDGSKAFLMSSLTSMYHIVYIDNKWL